jgi:AraC family ethanolamine operon transcriptional activator
MSWKSDPPQKLLVDASFSEVEKLCSTVVAWDLDFSAVSDVRTTDVGRLIQLSAGEIDHGYARFHLPLLQRGTPPAGKVTFTILGLCTRLLWWRGHQVDNGQILVFDEGIDLDSSSGQDFETHVVSIPCDLLEAICNSLGTNLPTVAKCGEVFRPPPTVVRAIRTSLDDLLCGQGTRSDYLSLIEKLIIAWGANDYEHQREGRRLAARNRDRAMNRCLEIFDTTNIALLNTDVIRDRAGVSARTLEYSFQERFNVGPARFIKARKLGMARRLLTSNCNNPMSVSEIMSIVGLWHVGQFARDYRMLFGELPSQTLTRIR